MSSSLSSVAAACESAGSVAVQPKRKIGKVPALLWRTGVWPALYADAYVENTQLEGAMSSRWSLLAYASALQELLRDEALSSFVGLRDGAGVNSRLRSDIAALASSLEACAATSCSRERDEMLEEDPDRDESRGRNLRHDYLPPDEDADGACYVL